MKVEFLQLEGFRNIERLELRPSPGVNIVYGDNAQGKTNLIEALWLLTGSKSFRGAKDHQLLRFGSNLMRIFCEFWKQGRTQSAEIRCQGKKQTYLNEILQPSVTSLTSIFCAVVFSPSHLGLIQDGPGERRRFIDTCISQISPHYLRLIADYSRTLMQRNSLLKDISYSPALLDTLEVWEEKLVALAALVVRNRIAYVRRLAAYAGEIYSGISAGKEKLEIYYEASACADGEKELIYEEYSKWFRLALRQARGEDLRAGSTSIGPHRDDISLTINGIEVRSYGSQGQQRSAVLALKLAESRLLEELLEDRPIILLDDVMSELDAARQDYLLNHLSDNQVFITCCEAGHFDSLQEGRAFFMQKGALRAVMREA